MNVASLATTLPMLLVGMLGIFLVIGVIILVVTLLNKISSSKGEYSSQYPQTPRQLFPPGAFLYLSFYQAGSLATKTMPTARGPT